MTEGATAIFKLGLLMALLFRRTNHFVKHVVLFQKISLFRDRTAGNTEILGN